MTSPALLFYHRYLFAPRAELYLALPRVRLLETAKKKSASSWWARRPHRRIKEDLAAHEQGPAAERTRSAEITQRRSMELARPWRGSTRDVRAAPFQRVVVRSKYLGSRIEFSRGATNLRKI
jgi:hypothetical protein